MSGVAIQKIALFGSLCHITSNKHVSQGSCVELMKIEKNIILAKENMHLSPGEI